MVNSYCSELDTVGGSIKEHLYICYNLDIAHILKQTSKVGNIQLDPYIGLLYIVYCSLLGEYSIVVQIL